ncbi:MAG TPA: hypothetical protein VEW47_02415 [Candidatus Dormibacteraeota bacterium]|nr:hypothetical protein [Candidatus Dormibacteraeota bacterium]
MSPKKGTQSGFTDEERAVRKEYDSSRGVRGKYARRYAAGTNIVVLEPDVAKVFRDSRSVNQALRALTIIARQQRRKAS